MNKPRHFLATTMPSLAQSARAAALLLTGLLATWPLSAAETIALGTAQSFAVLGGSTVTNTGPSIVIGNLGVSPGTAVTGFPPGTVTGGAIHAGDAIAAQAHAAASAAFLQLQGETSNVLLSGQNLGGLTLTPGVYRFNTSAQLSGILKLDTGGDANAAFHFLIGSTLTADSLSSVVVLNLNGATDQNIFWQVGSSATIGTNTQFNGTILAFNSITLTTGVNVAYGRALAINGAVTLDTNNLNLIPVLPVVGHIWKGSASNLWSGQNWSPDLAGSSSGSLAPLANVIFSVTTAPQNLATNLDADTAISSLTVNDPTPVTISGSHVLSIVGAGAQPGVTINAGAGLTTINSNVVLGGLSQVVAVHNGAGLVVNGAIGGAVGLAKTGAGQLTLAGANTYAGQTTLAAGTLAVNGSIAGNALVAGGILRGVGRIGGNVVNAAAVNPGRVGAPGTLAVGGNFTQLPSGSLNLRLASTSDFDRLLLGGSARLGGALNVSYLDGFNAQAGDSFQILTADGGVSGKFAKFNDAHATGTLLTLGLVYEPNAVLLEFMQGSIVTALGGARLTPNERAVARGLDELATDHPGSQLIRELDNLPLSQLRGALDLLSSEDFAAIFTTGLAMAQVQTGNLERRLDEVRQGATGFSDSGFAVTDAHGAQNYDSKNVVEQDSKGGKEFVAPTVREQRWGFFISGTGTIGDLESTNDARGSSFTSGGVTVGADFRVNRHLVLGLALGYADTSADLSRKGSLDLNSGNASLYGTYYDGGFYLNGVVGGGLSSFDTKRRTLGGFARGETDAVDFHALLGTGYDFRFGAFTIGPVASLQYGTVGLDGFSEHGALGAMRLDRQSQDSLTSALGVKASYAKKLGRVVFVPEVRVQWEHEFLTSQSSIEAGYGSGASFTTHGPGLGRDGLRLDAGASAQLSSHLAVFAYYTGELGRENYTVHSVNGGLRISF